MLLKIVLEGNSSKQTSIIFPPCLLDTLKRLKEYKEVKVPIYNFVTHRREERMVPMYGANVIIFEGIFAFHDKKVVDLLDMKVGFCLDTEMTQCI